MKYGWETNIVESFGPKLKVGIAPRANSRTSQNCLGTKSIYNVLVLAYILVIYRLADGPS